MGDRERQGFHGPARSCTTENTTWVPKTACDGMCVPAERPGTISYRNGLKVRTFTVPPEIAAKPNTSFGH